MPSASFISVFLLFLLAKSVLADDLEAIPDEPTEAETQTKTDEETKTEMAAKPPLDKNYDISFTFEDDYPGISFWGNDRSYTAGWRLSYNSATPKLPSWSRPFLGWFDKPTSEYNYGFALGQQIYTPEDVSTGALITNDEPYAGYLFVGTSVQLRNENVLHSLELDVGIVGPPSLAGPTQISFHQIFGFEPVLGWANQLHTEPTLTLFYQEKIRLFQIQAEGDNNTLMDFVPFFEGAVGNLYIYGGLGAQLRMGYHISDDFGLTVLTPVGVDPYVVAGTRHFFEIYVFASAEGRGMVRNLFLDGNTFEASNHIQKLPFVRDFDFGLLMRIGSFRCSWRQIGRGEEYTPETAGPHAFASIDVTYTQRL
jgi:lipid A 3-O-deacylase